MPLYVLIWSFSPNLVSCQLRHAGLCFDCMWNSINIHITTRWSPERTPWEILQVPLAWYHLIGFAQRSLNWDRFHGFDDTNTVPRNQGAYDYPPSLASSLFACVTRHAICTMFIYIYTKFCSLFCCGYYQLSLQFHFPSLALGQSYDSPNTVK